MVVSADTLFGADLTIMEEGTELLHRLQDHLEQHPNKEVCASARSVFLQRAGRPFLMVLKCYANNALIFVIICMTPGVSSAACLLVSGASAYVHQLLPWVGRYGGEEQPRAHPISLILQVTPDDAGCSHQELLCTAGWSAGQ